MAKQRILCLVHIPLQYPDRSEIDRDEIDEFLSAFERRFQGATDLGVVQGLWEGIREPMLRVEVAIFESDVEAFKAMAREVGKKTRQQAMYVVVNWRARAQILFVDEPESDDPGQAAGGVA